ncbi:hypothetical protein [Arsenicicoccus dermatophilus]|uniref:hypothetical protein n=1 Tax=Arsenicicoccus dermatophilus TaxID=1076331 RepID=UPI001F4C863A|nr:hypothetical protein [Arsenicicoccus dermatophilus]MCH8614222.1 hypothetical protein [Arsenicicoccus dermatophilus]
MRSLKTVAAVAVALMIVMLHLSVCDTEQPASPQGRAVSVIVGYVRHAPAPTRTLPPPSALP